MKYYETHKLFYGKYLYKLSFYNDLNAVFRTEFQKDGTLGYAKEKLDTLEESYKNGDSMQLPVYRTWRNIDAETFLDARHVYNTLVKSKDYRVRVESFGGMSIFSNDYGFLEDVASGLKTNRIEMHKPDDSITQTLLDQKNIIISPTPVEWIYKVTLGNLIKDYSGFVNWINNNSEKIKIGEVALREMSINGYVSGYYFFVKSDKMLNMVSIMVGDNIRRVDEIIYKDNIDK